MVGIGGYISAGDMPEDVLLEAERSTKPLVMGGYISAGGITEDVLLEAERSTKLLVSGEKPDEAEGGYALQAADWGSEAPPAVVLAQVCWGVGGA